MNNNSEGIDILFKKEFSIEDLGGMTAEDIEHYVTSVVQGLEPEIDEEDIIAIIKRYIVIVDDSLSMESTNPVQNKVITEEVKGMKEQLQDVGTTIGNIDVLLGTI